MALETKPIVEFARWVAGDRRDLVLAVMLAAAVAALSYRDAIMAGNFAVLIVILAWGLLGGFAGFVVWGCWRRHRARRQARSRRQRRARGRSLRRFRALAPETEQCLAEFDELRGTMDIARFERAASAMVALQGKLVPLDVFIAAATDPTDESVKENVKTLRMMILTMHAEDLDTAQQLTRRGSEAAEEEREA